MKTFEQAWAEKEAQGYQYGEDALEGVRFGWQIHAETNRFDLAATLDLLDASNVSPREAAAALRAGRTLEELCEERSRDADETAIDEEIRAHARGEAPDPGFGMDAGPWPHPRSEQ